MAALDRPGLRPYGRRVLPTRFVNLDAARAEFGDRVDRLGAYLTRADPLADELARSMDALAPGVGWSLFSRVLDGESGALAEAPAPMRALVDAVDSVPVWVDWEQIEQGGRVLLRAGPVGGLVLGFKSLVLAYTSPAGNKPLVFSGRLTEQASKRLAETARFVRETISPGGMRPGAPGWRLTLQVRLIHAKVRRMILASGRWDADAWGAPISQHDEAGTSLLFSCVLLDGLRQLGLTVTADEAEAYMHLWRWSGWLMGLEPDLLPATEREGARLASLMRATQGPPDADSRALARALLEAPLREPRERGERRVGGGRGERAAARAVRIGSALARALVGDPTADALGVARTGWERITPLVPPLVRAAERARGLWPSGPVAALRAGQRYWDAVAAGDSVLGSGAALPLPGRLAARRASDRQHGAAAIGGLAR